MHYLPALVSVIACAATGLGQVIKAPITGAVVDDKGQPVTDAVLEVFRGEGRGFHILDLEYRHSWVPLAKTPVDKHGRFGLQLPVGLIVRVEVVHPKFARWRQDDLVPGDDVRIELEAPGTFRGQLVLAGTGAPTTGSLRAWDRHHTEVFQGRTDAEGRFEFTHLPAGGFTCDAEPDVAMVPRWFRTDLGSGQILEHRFELEPGVRLRGKVTDVATGLPIAGARIGENWTLDKLVRSKDDGTYEMRGYGQAGAPTVTCLADGYARTALQRPAVLADPTTMDFSVVRGVPVHGRILTPDGKPQAGVYVAVVGVHDREIAWLPMRTGVDGWFRIDSLDRRGDGFLLVRCDGFASAVYGLPRAEDGIKVGDLQLQAAQVVRGVVRDRDGRPVPNARVLLNGRNADHDRLAAGMGNWSRVDLYLAERVVRADGNGNFAFGDVPVGKYLLGFDARPKTVTPAGAIEVEVDAGGAPAVQQLVR